MYKDRVVHALRCDGFSIFFQTTKDLFYIDFIEVRDEGRGKECFKALLEITEGFEIIGGRFTNFKFKEDQERRGVKFFKIQDICCCKRTDLIDIAYRIEPEGGDR